MKNLNKIKKPLRGLRDKFFNKRERLSRKWLKGTGLEIGALHRPLKVPDNVTVLYVDCFTREHSIEKFPKLPARDIVPVSIIDDGFELSCIEGESYDFVVANHVLEHSPNPIQVLVNWVRVLRPDGILFITIPVAERCFDKGRLLTTIDHLKDDYQLCLSNSEDEMLERNKEHLREWINVSERAIREERDSDYRHPSPEEIEKRVKNEDMTTCEMHYHTFSRESYLELLTYFATAITTSVIVEEVIQNSSEIISILRRKSPEHAV
ncbi:methyltransferase domain-containing protein [Arenicellales bacterium IMCC58067]